MRKSSLDKIEKLLYEDRGVASKVLSPSELEKKTRLMLCVTKKFDSPLIPDTEIVEYLMGGCGGACQRIQRSQAYRDLANINRMVGNITLAGKSWYRYMIIEGAKKAYDLAMSVNDAKAAAAALDKIGKYTRCDKEDSDIDWSEMIAPSLEPSDDLTLIEGLESIPADQLEKRRQHLRSLFKDKLAEKADDIEESDE